MPLRSIEDMTARGEMKVGDTMSSTRTSGRKCRKEVEDVLQREKLHVQVLRLSRETVMSKENRFSKP